MRPETFGTIFGLVLGVGCAALILFAYGRYDASCRAKGGVPFHGYGGSTCIAGREIKP